MTPPVHAVLREKGNSLLQPQEASVPNVDDGHGSDLYARAVVFATRDKASTSYLQRRLQIGFNQAAGLIERMESEGLISRANHAGLRTILKPYDAILSEGAGQ